MIKVTIYSDGGADPNPGVGGWAAILQAGGREKILSGSDPSTTNNRMELTAAIAALKALTRPVEVIFNTDSEYLRKGITEWAAKWQAGSWQRKGKPIPNADLWETLLSLAQGHQIEWHWVRGHTGDPMNERVDRLARKARLLISDRPDHLEEMPKLYLRATCKGNPGPGGWGVVLEADGQTEQFSGSEAKTTNNRMELQAAIEGLDMMPAGSSVQLITTSDYVFQGATKWIHGWRKRNWTKRDGKPVSNQDLWLELERLMDEHRVYWLNAKGQDEYSESGMSEAASLARAALELER